ncbi:MAG TPA: flagellar basal body P-ring formation chaperone FlgA [Pseudorhodoplanes sp.]|jgi:flagella basal body P-ring formation protein FlgA|nr:flagellar basal body P-ring formation chaperone FlgA [Pseudorhodoplanes sp.]
MIRIVLIAALIAIATPARAETTAIPAAPVLKSDVVVSGELVRIGDLVENAGIASSIAVFRSPNPGTTGTVPVENVLDALRAHAVIGVDTRGLVAVNVTRAGRVIAREEIEARIARDIARISGIRDPKSVGLVFDQEPLPIEADIHSTGELKTERLTFDRRTGRFNIIILLPGEHRNWRYAGVASEVFEAAMLTRPVVRGEILRASDITVEKRPKSELTADMIADARLAVGQAAKRAMRPGQPLRQGDLMKPELVQRNEPVLIVYEVPGISLTLRGKALESGSEGDVVEVLNIQSKRTMQGTVIGNGQVLVSPATPPARVASINTETGAEDR